MLLLELLKSNKKKTNKKKSLPVNKLKITNIIISTLLGIIAFYLSWDCNTKLGYSISEKILYGFFAFLFGGLYIILYLIFRAGTCQKIK